MNAVQRILTVMPGTFARENPLLTPAIRMDLVRQYGDFTIAWSTAVQPGLKYYGNEHGYLAFASGWGIDFALGDPVAPRELHAPLLEGFMASCRRKPCFVNCMETTAALVAPHRYFINPMGVDTLLPLEEYDFRGKAREPFRYAANWLDRRGYRIEELTFRDIDAGVVAGLSGRWRQTRTISDREVGFLNRPIALEDEQDVRKFFLLDAAGKPAAFVYLDPVYRNGRVTGYSTSIKRRDPEAPACSEQGIMKHCIELLKAENVQTVRLGLSPLANLTDRRFRRRNPILHFSLSCGFRARWLNRRFYNLQGHAEFKRRFRGVEQPVYFISPALFNDYRIIAMLRIMNVF
jgi:phosphatidylglycerol lysyltransferase